MTLTLEGILAAVCAALLLTVLILLIVLLRRQGRKAAQLEEGMKNLTWQMMDQADALHDEQMKKLEQQAGAMDMMNRSHEQGMDRMNDQITGLRQEQTATLTRLDASMNRVSQTAAAGLASIQKETREQMTSLRQENGAQLTELRKTVDEKLTENLNSRLKQSFSQVSEELEKVYKSLGEMQSLASSVGDLKKVLTNVKTRGTWGEMQLGSILESILAPGQYGANVQVVPGSGEVVEYAVRLPGHDGSSVWLPLDSKFPQEDYLRVYEAAENGDKAALDAARKALDSSIKNEAKRIAKYIRAPYSTDFAVMFLPVEGLYAEVVRSPELISGIQEKYRVVVAGPSTLAALLNSLQMGFRTLAIQKRSSEVWKLLGTIRTDFETFSDVLQQTQNRLTQASASLDKAFSQSRRIQKDLSGVQSLEEEAAAAGLPEEKQA